MLTESHAQGPATPAIREITLGDLLKEAADACPHRAALIVGSPDVNARRQWTYRELYEDAVIVARALSEKFVPGERVAVWASNIPQWVLLEFGSAMAGVILVTVNPALQAKEVEYVLTQSRSAGIFVMSEFRGNQMLATVEQIRPDCPDLREIVCFDEWEHFMAAGQASNAELPLVRPLDATMIQYTSGTTGFPKGALLHHRGLANNAAHTLDRLGVKEGETWITTMPLFHTGGCVICVLGAVANRMTQVLVEAFEPGLVLELIETYKGNSLIGVPTMLIAMLEHPAFKTRDLSSIRQICSGGSTVPAALVKRLEAELNAQFSIVFGQTECSPVAQMTSPDDTLEDKAETLGTPMPNVEVKIIDPETGATQSLGTLGEYCTRGYHVMHEYFGMEEATAKTIDEEGWLHTGDLCSMDERGYCKIEGRLKDMIIRGGENIYPREIEETLFRHPTVGDVAVIGLPDERMGEVVAAFVRPVPGERLDRNALFDYLRDHLSPQKTPKHWFAVDEFPLTGSGKIQKFVLKQQWQDGKFQELS